MIKHRPWSPEEDQTLKNLYQKIKLNKWSLIAAQMDELYNFKGRTGKQCKQRYMMHLDDNPAKDTWTVEEERLLIHMHDTMGNKWAIIALKLGGRSDNSVKNHFYSKLRKAMRKINKIIKENYKKQLKELKLNVLYKIIEASEQKFKSNPCCDANLSEFCCELKNQIIQFSFSDGPTIQPTKFKQLLSAIHQFNKNYKRKPKCMRRGSGTSDYLSIPLQIKRTKSIPDNEQSDGSDPRISQQICESSSDNDGMDDNDADDNIEHDTISLQRQIQLNNLKKPLTIRQAKTGIMHDEHEMELQDLIDFQNMHHNSNDLDPNQICKQTPQESNIFDVKQQNNYFFQDSEMEMPNIPFMFQNITKKQSFDERLFH